MRSLIFGAILLFAVINGNAALGRFGPYSQGASNDIDIDLLYFGGELIPGRPKFKLSQHPDGYSVVIGADHYFMRIQFSNIDNSIDFNILDTKGSIKYRVKNWSPNGPDLEGTLELVSNQPKTPIETTIKLKYKRPKTGQWASPLDPYDIEITFINLMNSLRSVGPEVDIGGEWVKDAKYVDMSIKMMITPKNLAGSTLTFNMGTKGKLITGISDDETEEDIEYFSEYGRSSYDSNDYYSRSEGTFNMSASLMVIKVVEPTGGPNAPLPSIMMALDLETNRFIEHENKTVMEENNRSWKKSILLEGMVNPTGKGARLGVLKLTDADTSKSIGRIQARRKDAENLRFEVFAGGNEIGALNYHESATGYTNITVEAQQCGGSGSSKGPLKLYERMVGDTKMEQRFYRDIFEVGKCTYDSESVKRFTEGTEGLFYEEKLSSSQDKYMYNLLLSNGREFKNLYINLDNKYNMTKFQIGVMGKYKNYGSNELNLLNSDRLDLDIKPSSRERGEYDLKVGYNQRPIFEGWFKGLDILQQFATEDIPYVVEMTFRNFKQYHMNTMAILNQYV